MKEQEFRKLYHLAWDGLPNRSNEFSELNLNNSVRLIENLVTKNDIELNVFGSCLEYGDLEGCVEDGSIPNGRDAFAIAKIQLNQYVKNLGVPYRWYRPFFVYGLGQHKDAECSSDPSLCDLDLLSLVKLRKDAESKYQNTFQSLALSDYGQCLEKMLTH